MNTAEMLRELAFAEANVHHYTKKELRTVLRLSHDALLRVSDSRKKLKTASRQKDRAMLRLLVS